LKSKRKRELEREKGQVRGLEGAGLVELFEVRMVDLMRKWLQ